MVDENIKTAIKNINTYLAERHNECDTVVMTAKVLKSIRDNYNDLLRYKATVERLQSDNVKLHTIIPKMIVEAKSEAYREFAEKALEKVKTAYFKEVNTCYESGYADALTFVEDLIDEIKEELTEKKDLEEGHD